MSKELEERVAVLEADVGILMGRLNALHEALIVLVLEREGPTEDILSHLRMLREQSTSNMLASHLREDTIKEHLQVSQQLIACAESVVRTRGTPRWRNNQPA